MSYVHTKFDGICTDMKSESIKVFFFLIILSDSGGLFIRHMSKSIIASMQAFTLKNKRLDINQIKLNRTFYRLSLF